MRAKYQKAIEKIFKKTGKDVGKQAAKLIKSHLKVHKADDDDSADEILNALDLSGLYEFIDITPEILHAIMTNSGTRSLAQIGVADRGDLVNQNYDNAVDYSETRAAELVGKRYINGKLVDNPNAEWSIPEATRDELRDIITDAFAGKIPANEVESAIANAGSFSSDRASLIARTEISAANNRGALEGYRAARDKAGVAIKKAWHPDDEACPVCLDNAADGVIDLDDVFTSGDDAPPAHPNCECTIIPVTGSAAESNSDDDSE